MNKKVKIIRAFELNKFYGELEYFPYQIAFGISIRILKCKGMGWMIRIYFAQFKLWFNLRTGG